MKINFDEFNVSSNGELDKQISGDVVVKEIEVKDYSRGKFLSMVLSDGKTNVKAVEWNYTPAQYLPNKNEVCSISGKIGLYNGDRNITISSIMPGATPITDFIKSNVNIVLAVELLNELVDDIRTPELSKGVKAVLSDYLELLKVVPSARSHHHDYYAGNLQHTLEVALSVSKICDLCKLFGYDVNKDLAVVGAILHDIGKCNCYKMDGLVPEMTEVGKIHDHIVEGILIINKYRETFGEYYDLLDEIICSHHGKLEYGSPVTPCFLEAYIVSTMDGLSAGVAGMSKELESQSTRWGIKKSYAFQTYLLNYKLEDKKC